MLCNNIGAQDLGNEYLKCPKCGLIFFSGKMTQKRLLRSYTGGWLKSFRRKLLTRFRKFEHWGQFNDFMQKAEKITLLVQKNLHGKDKINILDVGCNKGFLLASSINKGWNAYGIELVAELLIPFKNKYKTFAGNIFISKFADVRHKFKIGHFDVITAIDVVEHFEDPLRDMKGIFDLLKPGGILVVQTADTGSKNAEKTGDKWGALKPFEHLFLFNKENYRTLARSAGFRETVFYEPFEEADGNFAAISKKL